MEELLKKLTGLGLDEAKAKDVTEKATTDGATDLAGAALLTEADWIGYGVPKVTARKLIKELTDATKPAPAATAAPAVAMTSLIPSIPNDESFLAGLTTGGVLKPSENDVQAAIRALFASRYGLFEIDERLIAAIEARAEEMEEPLPDLYYEVQKSLARKAHSDVLAALGVSSKIVSQANVKKFLGRMSSIWSELAGFYEVVDGYVQNWQANMGPQAMLGIVSALTGGGAGLVPGMNEAPDATPIADQARGIIDRINKMFAGPGIPVARALAADAKQLTDLIKKPELINAIGAANRDEMLKKLGIGVGADAFRTEQSVLQFALCVLRMSSIEATQLPGFVVAVRQTGANVPWSQLTGRPNGVGTGRVRTARPGDSETFGAGAVSQRNRGDGTF